jgi:hypothetical protein
MNQEDYFRLEEHFWSAGIDVEIDRLPTYQERSTLSSQMRAMWRLFNRRGKQFDAREWWARKQGQT